MNKKCIVTTSWDDGHRLDIRLAKLLKKYHIAGTFYVCPFDREFIKEDVLTNRQILLMGKDFEIGAHTMTHPHLTKIPLQEADDEIRGGKKYLENIIGRQVVSFCYPGGYRNTAVQKLVQQAGFRLGRTVSRYAFSTGNNPFALPTTFHTYNHFSDVHKIFGFACILSPSTPLGVKLYRYTDWEYLAMDLFDHCLKERLMFHLFGHSWELEKFGWWKKLERVLRYISARNNAVYIPNGKIPL